MPRLCFVDDSEPGITRRKMGRGWGYFDASAKRITDRDEIDRLNAIGLPPAYANAWFCPSPNGHIQAIGYDEKGRKQYRYHGDFRAKQEAVKYESLRHFGEALPKLREQAERDLRRTSLCKERAVAAVVRLLDGGEIRIGNESYARDNKSFGATTLRKRHATLKGSALRIAFLAKSGKQRVMRVTDKSLLRFVKRCQDLPGQHLFRYLDDAGEARPVTSTDVNDYIRETTGEEFTAKHFRTWGASVLAFEALVAAKGDLKLRSLLEPVAEALGNTPAIARKSYIHPSLIELVQSGALWEEGLQLPRATKYLSRAERGFLAFLEQLSEGAASRKAA